MPSSPRRLGWALALAIASLQMLVGRVAVAQTTPVGFWNTISDVTGKPTGLVEIREENGELVGIVRGILVSADAEDSICTKCRGDQKGKRIVGMVILRHMHRDGDEWSGGEILDPETGKTYRAKLKLTDGGKKLVVRGYVGLSLFGRSQTWVRQP